MTIATAIDKINDKLAGSDQPSAQTIEQALELLLDNIGEGGGSIPIASADTLGGVKVGSGLSVTEEGVLSASGGGGGGIYAVEVVRDGDNKVSTKTVSEILEMAESGFVYFTYSNETEKLVQSPILSVLYEDGEYAIPTFDSSGTKIYFTANSLDGYPTNSAM